MSSEADVSMLRLLMACGPINLGFLAVFAPPSIAARRFIEFPEPPAVVTWVLAAWILVFGAAYFWMGWTACVSRPLLAIGATGKGVFGLVVVGLLAAGELSALTALVAVPDVALAAIFFGWLFRRG